VIHLGFVLPISKKSEQVVVEPIAGWQSQSDLSLSLIGCPPERGSGALAFEWARSMWVCTLRQQS
jgi:hypothetical protein